MTTKLTLPQSGVVLGRLVDALDLRRCDESGALSSSNRTTARFFAGERVGDDAEQRIWLAAGACLIKSDLLPAGFELRGPTEGAPPETVLGIALASFARHWDALAGALHRLAAPVFSVRLALVATLQLIVVDLAARLTAILWLSRTNDMEPPPIPWAEDRGLPRWLRHMQERAGVSRDAFAKGARVHQNSVDGWLDAGVRPNDDNLQDIADVLASNGVGDREQLLRVLRLNYALRNIFVQVEEVVGREYAIVLADRLVSYAWWMLNVPRASQRGIAEADTKMHLTVVFGTVGRGAAALPWVEPMLNSAWRIEDDPVWRTSIKSATRSWFERLREVAANLPPDAEDSFRRHFGSVPPREVLERFGYVALATREEQARDPRIRAASDLEVRQGGYYAGLELKIRARDAIDRGDLLGAIDLLRRALQEDPNNAEIHFRLGACLWQVGDVKTGLDELEIAVQLDPAWDRAQVEIAIVLLNEDRNEEAAARLQRARELLREPSTWLLLHLGCALERLGRKAEAATTYEELIALDDEHAEALDHLAHLYFVAGRKREAAAHAKRAAHLGFTDVFDAWEAGYYDRKGISQRPPRTTPQHLVQLGENRWLTGTT